MQLNYSINGVSFSSLGIVVSDSDGVVDGLTLKEPFSVNWPEAHGLVVDLNRPRFEPREITLECFLLAATPSAFIAQNNALKIQLAKSGTQRLYVQPIQGKPLVFEVYAPNGYKIKKKWRDAMTPSPFTLKLIEPQPVKMVLSATSGATASLRITAPSPITVYWGDGTNDVFFGVNQTITHTYGGSGGTYYAIISGELEVMTLHQKTNLTDVWPLLY